MPQCAPPPPPGPCSCAPFPHCRGRCTLEGFNRQEWTNWCRMKCVMDSAGTCPLAPPTPTPANPSSPHAVRIARPIIGLNTPLTAGRTKVQDWRWDWGRASRPSPHPPLPRCPSPRPLHIDNRHRSVRQRTSFFALRPLAALVFDAADALLAVMAHDGGAPAAKQPPRTHTGRRIGKDART